MFIGYKFFKQMKNVIISHIIIICFLCACSSKDTYFEHYNDIQNAFKLRYSKDEVINHHENLLKEHNKHYSKDLRGKAMIYNNLAAIYSIYYDKRALSFVDSVLNIKEKYYGKEVENDIALLTKSNICFSEKDIVNYSKILLEGIQCFELDSSFNFVEKQILNDYDSIYLQRYYYAKSELWINHIKLIRFGHIPLSKINFEPNINSICIDNYQKNEIIVNKIWGRAVKFMAEKDLAGKSENEFSLLLKEYIEWANILDIVDKKHLANYYRTFYDLHRISDVNHYVKLNAENANNYNIIRNKMCNLIECQNNVSIEILCEKIIEECKNFDGLPLFDEIYCKFLWCNDLISKGDTTTAYNYYNKLLETQLIRLNNGELYVCPLSQNSHFNNYFEKRIKDDDFKKYEILSEKFKRNVPLVHFGGSIFANFIDEIQKNKELISHNEKLEAIICLLVAICLFLVLLFLFFARKNQINIKIFYKALGENAEIIEQYKELQKKSNRKFKLIFIRLIIILFCVIVLILLIKYSRVIGSYGTIIGIIISIIGLFSQSILPNIKRRFIRLWGSISQKS